MGRASAYVAVIACLLLLAGTAPLETRAQPAAATPIKHIIVIVQENHSFDNYFGTYPTANGTLVDSITSALPDVNGIPDGVCSPYGNSCIEPHLTNSTDPTNPTEGQLVYEMDYADNATGFANNSGVQSMVYFDYHSVPAYWDYAEEYGLADNYFSSVLTQSNPNRLMLLAGDTPVVSDDGPPPYLPYNQTLMSQLDGAGVTWGYFDWTHYNGSQWNIHILNYISGMPSQAVGDVQDLSALSKDLAAGTGLPDVSFVSSLGNKTYDEHPSADPTLGEQWVTSVVNQVMKSSYWNSTAIFITWDEGGGFYDHVVPPSVFTVDHNFTSPLLGFGQRVPLLVISPYSKESYVSSVVMSHLSLVHFIEYNWDLSALNPLVGDSNLPLSFFDFTQPPRAPIVLGTTGAYSMQKYPVPLQPMSTVVTRTVTSTETQTRTSNATQTMVLTSTVTSTYTASPTATSGSASASAVSPQYVPVAIVGAAAIVLAGIVTTVRTRRRSFGS